MVQKIIISTNSVWNIVNFRSNLVRAMIDKGVIVVALAPPDEHVDKLLDLGCKYIPLSMQPRGVNLIKELHTFLRYVICMYQEKPDVFYGFTVKPNVYGTIAARLFNIKTVNNIAGLGSVFVEKTWLTRFIKLLYKFALSGSDIVFFQNDNDQDLFVKEKIVKKHACRRIPGSGVDLQRFSPLLNTTKTYTKSIRFLFVGRLLWDKGLLELAEAIRNLKQRHTNIEFLLLGFTDETDPAVVPKSQIETWETSGIFRYFGTSDDVEKHIVAADCVILPSYYREGVPRSLLEALACGIPIITTDSIGCRDTVDDGVNGFLCKPKCSSDLEEKIEHFISLPKDQHKIMGANSRNKARNEFDENFVIKKYLATLD